MVIIGIAYDPDQELLLDYLEIQELFFSFLIEMKHSSVHFASSPTALGEPSAKSVMMTTTHLQCRRQHCGRTFFKR